MAFFAHLLIAGSFIMLFYIGVNYSALKYEIDQIEALQEKMHLLNEDQRPYHIIKYNKTVERYNSLRKSVFAIPLLKLCKKLDRNFEMLN